MNRKPWFSGALLGVLASVHVQAQTEEEATKPDQDQQLDIIMTIVDEGDTPEAIYNRIELPPAPPPVEIVKPQVEVDPQLREIKDAVDDLTKDTTGAVTERLNDALTSGDIESLPDTIRETIPDEVIEDLVEGSTGDVKDIVDGVDETLPDVPNEINAAIEDLENTVSESKSIVEEAEAISRQAEALSETAEEAAALEDVVEDVETLPLAQ